MLIAELEYKAPPLCQLLSKLRVCTGLGWKNFRVLLVTDSIWLLVWTGHLCLTLHDEWATSIQLSLQSRLYCSGRWWLQTWDEKYNVVYHRIMWLYTFTYSTWCWSVCVCVCVCTLTVNEAPREARNARADIIPALLLDIPFPLGWVFTGLWPSRNLM